MTALFFGLCTAVLGMKALHNDEGVSFIGVITLSPRGATVFFWILTALSAGFVALAVLLAINRVTTHQQIVLTDASVVLPRSRWSREGRTVQFADIVRLSLTTVSGERFLTIVYREGKFTLTASMLPRASDFDEICAAIIDKSGAPT